MRCAAMLLAISVSLLTAGKVSAEEPVLHNVTYTVGASQPLRAEIYYRDTDPANWADYSHDPYAYSPNVEADLGPGKPWALDTELADPQQWAMVVVSGPAHAAPLAEPGFVCELRVDGVVVASDAGTKGALCSWRTW